MLVRDYYDFHVDAYLSLIEYLESKLPQVTLTEPTASSFSTLVQTLDHIYLTDKLWFEVLQGFNPQLQTETPEVDKELSVLQEQFILLHEQMRKLLFQEEASLEQETKFKNNRGGETSVFFEEIVMTMVNHGTYHRGAISSMLRQHGYHGESMDFLFYMRSRRRRRRLLIT